MADDRRPDRGSLGQNIVVVVIMMAVYVGIGSILKRFGRRGAGADRLPVPPESLRGGYEVRDMSFGAVAAFGIGLLALLGVIALVLVGLYGVFASQQTQANNLPSPLMATRQPPPEPRLEVVPGLNLEQLRAQEDRLLNSYGWVDQDHGVIHIPIDRAIDLLAEHGLPTRPQGQVIRGEDAKWPQ
jgi:hypothetical protein